MFRLLDWIFDLFREGDLPITILLIIVIVVTVFIDKDFRHFIGIFVGALRRLLPHTP